MYISHISYLCSCSLSSHSCLNSMMPARHIFPTCSRLASAPAWGTRFPRANPSALLIPFCPHTPRHILSHAQDPRVQAELADSINSILAPNWLLHSANGYPPGSTPSPRQHRFSPDSHELFSSRSSHIDLDDMVGTFSPQTSRPSAPLPTTSRVTDPPVYVCPSARQVTTAPHDLPTVRHGLSPSSATSSMSSWDSGTRNAACSLLDDTSRPSLPRAIVKPQRFHFRPIREHMDHSGHMGGPSSHHVSDSPSSSVHITLSQRTPTAPPIHEVDHVSASPSTVGEAFALPRPLHETTNHPPLSQDLVRSLCNLQQHPINATIQSWLHSQPPNPSAADAQQDFSCSDLCSALGPPSSDLPPSTTPQ